MMIRYAKNYLKTVNRKGWIRTPVCLHSTDTKRDFPDGAQGNQKETTKPANLSDQPLCKPLTDPGKPWTKGIQDGATLCKKDICGQNGQGLLIMKTSLGAFQQCRFFLFSNCALAIQRFIHSILSGPSSTLSAIHMLANNTLMAYGGRNPKEPPLAEFTDQVLKQASKKRLAPRKMVQEKDGKQTELLIDQYEAISWDVYDKCECSARPTTIEPTMQPMCPPYTPPPFIPCPKPCVPPQLPVQPKCPPKIKKAIDCPKYPHPLPPCRRPRIPRPPPPCDCKEKSSSQLNTLPYSEIANLHDSNEPKSSKIHLSTSKKENFNCTVENSPSVNDELDKFSQDGKTNKAIGEMRLSKSSSNKTAHSDALGEVLNANLTKKSEIPEPILKFNPKLVKKPRGEEINMFDIDERIHEAHQIETENDVNDASKSIESTDQRNQSTVYRNDRFQSFISKIGISTSTVTMLASKKSKKPCPPPCCPGPVFSPCVTPCRPPRSKMFPPKICSLNGGDGGGKSPPCRPCEECSPPCHGPQAPIFCNDGKKKKCKRQDCAKPSPGNPPCCAPPLCTPPCPPPCSPCPIPPPPCLPIGPRIKYKPPPPQVPCSPCPIRSPPCPRPPPPMCPPVCPPPCRPRCPIYGPHPPTPECPGPQFVPSCPCPSSCPPPCEEYTIPPCCPQCPLPCPPKCPPPCPPTCPTKCPPQPRGPCNPNGMLMTEMVPTERRDKGSTPEKPSEELLPQSPSETESCPCQPKKVLETSACSCNARRQPLVVIPPQTTSPIGLPKKKICADTCPEICYDSKGKTKMCPAQFPDTEYCSKLEDGEPEYCGKENPYETHCNENCKKLQNQKDLTMPSQKCVDRPLPHYPVVNECLIKPEASTCGGGRAEKTEKIEEDCSHCEHPCAKFVEMTKPQATEKKSSLTSVCGQSKKGDGSCGPGKSKRPENANCTIVRDPDPPKKHIPGPPKKKPKQTKPKKEPPTCGWRNRDKIVTLGPQLKSAPLNDAKANFTSMPPPSPTPPFSEPPKASGGGDDPNNYKKFIWPLLVAIGALGGVYYSGVFEDKVNVIDPKSKKQKEQKRPIKKTPLHATEIPSQAKYLLIGGGTASFVAFRAIKANDPKAKVLIISGEDAYPYMRPPLSKEIWQYDKLPVDYNQLTFRQWNGRERSLYYEPPEFYLPPEKLDASENGGVAIATGWYVSRVDAENKKAYITVPGEEDKEISYDKCLIATGCTPRMLPQFKDASKDVEKRTVHFRNIRDLDRLWKKLEDSRTKSVVIIGGGFLGSELACSLGRNKIDNPDRKVIQIFKEPGSMGKALPEYLSKWTSKRVEAEGVEVMADTTVKDVDWFNGQVQLRLNDNRQIGADLVIVAVGSEPCTALAEASKLEVDPVHGGFLVNAELEARRDLYVAGDAACFYDPALGRRRVEHHDHAVVSGRLAGENMASSNPKSYQHQSMFWSDLSPDLGYEAIGLVDASLATVGVFAKTTLADTPEESEHRFADEKENDPQSVTLEKLPQSKTAEKNYGKGVIFYLKKDKLVGIVLWNVFNRMNIARQVLAQGKTYDDLNEVAKLFKIHEDEEA